MKIIWKWGGSKIKSNAIHQIGQQKQVPSSLPVSFLLVLPQRNSLHTALSSHFISTHHLFICSQGRFLNLYELPQPLVKHYNQMNPNLRPLFYLHIQHTNRCPLEWRRLIRKPEVAGCSLGISIPLPLV